MKISFGFLYAQVPIWFKYNFMIHYEYNRVNFQIKGRFFRLKVICDQNENHVGDDAFGHVLNRLIVYLRRISE